MQNGNSFEVVKVLEDIKVTDNKTLKVQVVRIKGQYVIGIREFITATKEGGYSGPTKSGMFMDRSLLNKFIKDQLWIDCLTALDEAEFPETKKKSKTKKAPKK
jgi:sensor domain CHASE-containing protein